MAKVRQEEVFECPECDCRRDSSEDYRVTIFTCEADEVEYDNLEEASNCCPDDALEDMENEDLEEEEVEE